MVVDRYLTNSIHNDIKKLGDSLMLFHIQCLGRKAQGVTALDKPVNAEVEVSQSGNRISLYVRCIHKTGGHGERCKASHPGKDKVGDGVNCPYSLDVPYYSDQALVNPY